uniref:Uncharacterized protein n=1 Tax=Arundo donax TaxID=35708 RepID=A0A0A9HC80_ARUDO
MEFDKKQESRCLDLFNGMQLMLCVPNIIIVQNQ